MNKKSLYKTLTSYLSSVGMYVLIYTKANATMKIIGGVLLVALGILNFIKIKKMKNKTNKTK